jgi:3-dehydroquinate synthase
MAEITATSYKIFINKNIEKDIIRFFTVNKNKYSKLFILVDENSLKYCYPQLVEKIAIFEEAEIIEIESGEEQKNIEVCTQIWSVLTELQTDKKALLVNLGGGVISDMGGFIAATYKRGIDFINIPTTLLAQVDASVGGKVGIDLNNIKNQIGVFNEPKAVFINPSFITTLPKRQVLSGFAEIIKHALISDYNYWERIKEINFSSFDNFNELIECSVIIKNKIVKDDFLEQGIRKTLNFGHTVGHAIETFMLEEPNKKALLHGEAIAIGMIVEAYLSNKICKINKSELNDITSFIINTYKPHPISEFAFHRLIELMKNDKKNKDGAISFALLSAIGKCEINKSASPDLIVEALKFVNKEIKIYNP